MHVRFQPLKLDKTTTYIISSANGYICSIITPSDVNICRCEYSIMYYKFQILHSNIGIREFTMDYIWWAAAKTILFSEEHTWYLLMIHAVRFSMIYILLYTHSWTSTHRCITLWLCSYNRMKIVILLHRQHQSTLNIIVIVFTQKSRNPLIFNCFHFPTSSTNCFQMSNVSVVTVADFTVMWIT